MVDVIRQHIAISQGAGGPKPHITGHRIRVQDVVIWHEKLGMTPAEILEAYPGLTLADIHAALAYYWDHHDAIEQMIAAERVLEENLRGRSPSLVQQKLRQPHGG